MRRVLCYRCLGATVLVLMMFLFLSMWVEASVWGLPVLPESELLHLDLSLGF